MCVLWDDCMYVHIVCRMQELGADLPKIAVMPQNEKDVLVLLEATNEMFKIYADIITFTSFL